MPEATPAVPIRDSLGAVSQYSAVLMRANTHTSSNTTDSSDSAVDVKRDNNAAPVSATSATDSTIPH